MVRRGALLGAALLPVALLMGGLADRRIAVSAGLGVALAVVNFAAHGLSLAWAAGVSVTAVQAVALGGFVLRMGVIVALLFAVSRTSVLSAAGFGISVIVVTLALLVYEARLVLSGLGGGLEIPADPVALAAADRLREREERL